MRYRVKHVIGGGGREKLYQPGDEADAAAFGDGLGRLLELGAVEPLGGLPLEMRQGRALSEKELADVEEWHEKFLKLEDELEAVKAERDLYLKRLESLGGNVAQQAKQEADADRQRSALNDPRQAGPAQPPAGEKKPDPQAESRMTGHQAVPPPPPASEAEAAKRSEPKSKK